MSELGILGVFCGISCSIGLFLALYFLSQATRGDQRSRLLGFLFLFLTLRIAKSVWYFILLNPGIIGLLMGFWGLSLAGPSLFLYLRMAQSKDHQFFALDLIHLVFPLLGGAALLVGVDISARHIYISGTIVLLGYLLGSCYTWWKQASLNNHNHRWNQYLLGGVALIWAALVYQHAAGTLLAYAIGAAFSALPFYFLLFQTFRKPPRFKAKPQPAPTANLDVKPIKSALEEAHLYLRPDCTLATFSERVGVPSYLISQLMGEVYGKTFPETINHFRIRAAKQKLLDQTQDLYTIESIARASGFKSQSAFYAAFKRETGQTPTQFRKQRRASANMDH